MGRDQCKYERDFQGKPPLDFEANSFYRVGIAPARKKPPVVDWSLFTNSTNTTYNVNHGWISAEDRSASRPVSAHRRPEMGRNEDSYRVMAGGRAKHTYTTNNSHDTHDAAAVTMAPGIKPSFDPYEPVANLSTSSWKSGGDMLRTKYTNDNTERETFRQTARGAASGAWAATRRTLTRTMSCPGQRRARPLSANF